MDRTGTLPSHEIYNLTYKKIIFLSCLKMPNTKPAANQDSKISRKI